MAKSNDTQKLKNYKEYRRKLKKGRGYFYLGIEIKHTCTTLLIFCKAEENK
jgi:hypothetical protein